MTFKKVTSVIEKFQWTSGNNGLSRITDIFVGIDNVAKKIKNSYIGVSDKAKRVKTNTTYYGSLRLTNTQYKPAFCHGEKHFCFGCGKYYANATSSNSYSRREMDLFNDVTLTRTNVDCSDLSGNSYGFTGFDYKNKKYVFGGNTNTQYVLSDNFTREHSFVVTSLNDKRAGAPYQRSVCFFGYALYWELQTSDDYYSGDPPQKEAFGIKTDTKTVTNPIFSMEKALGSRGYGVFNDRLYIMGGGPWLGAVAQSKIASSSSCSVDKNFTVTTFTLPFPWVSFKTAVVGDYLVLGFGQKKEYNSNFVYTSRCCVIDKNGTISQLSDFTSGSSGEGSNNNALSLESYAVFGSYPDSLGIVDKYLTKQSSGVFGSELPKGDLWGVGYHKNAIIFMGRRSSTYDSSTGTFSNYTHRDSFVVANV